MLACRKSSLFVTGAVVVFLLLPAAALRHNGFAAAAPADARKANGSAVCGKPVDRCNHPDKPFAAYELPFRLPRQLKANVEYRSVPFYAVVIRRQRDPACDGGEYTKSVEQFRARAQRLFPERKVFADQQCPDMGAVSYVPEKETDTSSKPVEAFVAVYAGLTEREAKAVQKKARKQFTGTVLRRMRVSYSRIVQ